MSSSIHIKKASAGSIGHNSRDNFSHSVVFTDEQNETSHTSKEAYTIYRQELAIRSQAYSDKTNQKLQSKAITHLSAVVNLNQHHTLKDLEPLKKHLEDTLDTKVFQISIHRDEGKLVSKKDEIILTSGEDFFKNPENDKLYFDKKYTKEINLDDYKIEKNYHAHIEMMGLDSNGNGIKRNKLSKFYLSNLQTVAAQTLQMERGINYYAQNIKAPKRLDVLEYKKENSKKREAHKEIKQELQNTKLFTQVALAETKYLHKEYQAKITALENVENSLKKELHGLNNEIAKIKSDDELKSKKIEELETRIDDLRLSNNRLDQFSTEYIKINTETALKLENQKIMINDLNAQKNDLKAKYDQTNQQLIKLRVDLQAPQIYKVNDLFHWIRVQFDQFIARIKELEERIVGLDKYIKVLETPLTKEEQAVRLIRDYKLEDKITDPLKIVELIEKSESYKNPNFYIHSTLCQVVQKIEQKNEQSQSVYQSR